MNQIFSFFDRYLSCFPTFFPHDSGKNPEDQTVVLEPNYTSMNIRLELIHTNDGFEIKHSDLTESIESRSKKEKPINIRLEVDTTNNSIEIKPNDSTNNTTNSKSSKNLPINIQLELVPVNNVINSNDSHDSHDSHDKLVDVILSRNNKIDSKSIINPNYIPTDPQLTEDVLLSIQLEENLKNDSINLSYNQVDLKSIENISTNIQLETVPINNTYETESVDSNIMFTLDLQSTHNPEDVPFEKELTNSEILNKRKSHLPVKFQSNQDNIPEEMHLNNVMDIEHDSTYDLDLQSTTYPEDYNNTKTESDDLSMGTLEFQSTVNPEDFPVEKEMTISDIAEKSYCSAKIQSIQDVPQEEIYLKNAMEIEHDDNASKSSYAIYESYASTDDDCNQNNSSNGGWDDDENQNNSSNGGWDDDENLDSTNDWSDDWNCADHLVDVWDVDYLTDDVIVYHVDLTDNLTNKLTNDDWNNQDHSVDVWDVDYFQDDVEDLIPDINIEFVE
ncbi:46382_t:CDS:2 [Gigaspora margarita]|uniref:46382_t:CDS:1 n=1 Tax=Gigaspora margarita TaxID=4874 RepID=A0ABN7UUA6_GIGMA|nr:46382_t:CDS:2 [Gigaspora margarita]